MKLTLYVPTLDDLWFRRRMLEDPETMAYNRAWGRTPTFPGARDMGERGCGSCAGRQKKTGSMYSMTISPGTTRP